MREEFIQRQEQIVYTRPQVRTELRTVQVPVEIKEEIKAPGNPIVPFVDPKLLNQYDVNIGFRDNSEAYRIALAELERLEEEDEARFGGLLARFQADINGVKIGGGGNALQQIVALVRDLQSENSILISENRGLCDQTNGLIASIEQFRFRINELNTMLFEARQWKEKYESVRIQLEGWEERQRQWNADRIRLEERIIELERLRPLIEEKDIQINE